MLDSSDIHSAVLKGAVQESPGYNSFHKHCFPGPLKFIMLSDFIQGQRVSFLQGVTSFREIVQ